MFFFGSKLKSPEEIHTSQVSIKNMYLKNEVKTQYFAISKWMETVFKSHGIKFMANVKATFLKKECPVKHY